MSGRRSKNQRLGSSRRPKGLSRNIEKDEDEFQQVAKSGQDEFHTTTDHHSAQPDHPPSATNDQQTSVLECPPQESSHKDFLMETELPERKRKMGSTRKSAGGFKVERKHEMRTTEEVDKEYVTQPNTTTEEQYGSITEDQPGPSSFPSNLSLQTEGFGLGRESGPIPMAVVSEDKDRDASSHLYETVSDIPIIVETMGQSVHSSDVTVAQTDFLQEDSVMFRQESPLANTSGRKRRVGSTRRPLGGKNSGNGGVQEHSRNMTENERKAEVTHEEMAQTWDDVAKDDPSSHTESALLSNQSLLVERADLKDPDISAGTETMKQSVAFPLVGPEKPLPKISSQHGTPLLNEEMDFMFDSHTDDFAVPNNVFSKAGSQSSDNNQCVPDKRNGTSTSYDSQDVNTEEAKEEVQKEEAPKTDQSSSLSRSQDAHLEELALNNEKSLLLGQHDSATLDNNCDLSTAQLIVGGSRGFDVPPSNISLTEPTITRSLHDMSDAGEEMKHENSVCDADTVACNIDVDCIMEEDENPEMLVMRKHENVSEKIGPETDQSDLNIMDVKDDDESRETSTETDWILHQEPCESLAEKEELQKEQRNHAGEMLENQEVREDKEETGNTATSDVTSKSEEMFGFVDSATDTGSYTHQVFIQSPEQGHDLGESMHEESENKEILFGTESENAALDIGDWRSKETEGTEEMDVAPVTILDVDNPHTNINSENNDNISDMLTENPEQNKDLQEEEMYTSTDASLNVLQVSEKVSTVTDCGLHLQNVVTIGSGVTCIVDKDAEMWPAGGDTVLEIQTQNKTSDPSISEAEGTEEYIHDISVEVHVNQNTVETNMTSEKSESVFFQTAADGIIEGWNISEKPENEVSNDLSTITEDIHTVGTLKNAQSPDESTFSSLSEEQKKETGEEDDVCLVEGSESALKSSCYSDLLSEESTAVSVCHITKSQTLTESHEESQESVRDAKRVTVEGGTDLQLKTESESKTSDLISRAEVTEDNIHDLSVLVREVEFIGNTVTVENVTNESDLLQNYFLADGNLEALKVPEHAENVSALTESGLLVQDNPMEGSEETNIIPEQSDINITPEDTQREEAHSEMSSVVHKRKMGSTRRPLKGNKGLRKGREHEDEHETLDNGDMINVKEETISLEYEQILDKSTLQISTDGAEEQEICEKKDVGLVEGSKSPLIQPSCISDLKSEESTAANVCHITESETHTEILEESQDIAVVVKRMTEVKDVDPHLETQNKTFDSSIDAEGTEQNVPDAVLVGEVIRDTVTEESNLNTESNAEIISGETDTILNQSEIHIPEDSHGVEDHLKLSSVSRRKMGSTRRSLRGNKGQKREKEEFDEINHDRKEIILEDAPSSAESGDNAMSICDISESQIISKFHGESQENCEDVEKIQADGETESHTEIQKENKATDSTTSEAEETEETVCETSVLVKEVELIGDKITLENMTSESDSLQNATASDAKPEALQVSDHADPEVLEEKDTIPKESDTNIIPKDEEFHSKLSPVVHKRKMGSTRRPLKGNRKGREHPDENETLDSEGMINVEKETMNLGDEPNLDESMLQSLNDGIKEQETEICEKKDVGLDEGCESSSCSSDVVSEESTAVIASHITESQTLTKIYEQSQKNTGDAEKVVVVEDTDLQLQTESQNQMSDSISKDEGSEENIDDVSDLAREIKMTPDTVTVEDNMTTEPDLLENYTLVDEKQESLNIQDNTEDVSAVTESGLLVQDDPVEGSGETNTNPGQIDISITPGDTHREEVHSEMSPVVHKRKMGSTRRPLKGNKGLRKGREHEDEHETLDNGDMINVKEETISLEYEQILDKSTLQISKDGAEEQEICEKKDVGLVEGSESALIQPSCISDLKSEESTAANVCHITESETHTEIHEESQEIAGVVKIMTDIEDVDPHLETQNKTFDSSIDAEGTEQNVPDAVLVGEIEVLRDTVTEDSNLTTESNAEIISGDTDTILNQSEISIPENSHGVEDHLKLSLVSRRKMGSTRRSLRGNKGQKREKEEFDEINHDRKEIILEDAPSSAESGDNAMSICDISESQTISKFHGESQEKCEDVEKIPAYGETESHSEIQIENKTTDSTTSEADETEETVCETSVLVKEVELIGDKITLENMTSESDSLQNATASDAKPEALQVSDHADPEVLEEKDTIPKESDTNIIPKDEEFHSKLSPVVHKRKMGSTRRPLKGNKGNRKGREHPDENETLDSEGKINVEKETMNLGDEPNLDESMLQSLNDGIKEQETEICEKKDVGLDEGCESSSCSSDVVSEESTAVIASHIAESQTLMKIHEQSQENTGDAEKVVVVEDTDLQLQIESQNQTSDSTSKGEGSEENIDDVSDLAREIKMTPDTVTVGKNMTTEPDLLENDPLVDEKQESLNIQDNTEDVLAVTESGLLVQDDSIEGSGETNTNPGQNDIAITPEDTYREEVHSEMSPVVHKRKMGSTRRPLRGNKGQKREKEFDEINHDRKEIILEDAPSPAESRENAMGICDISESQTISKFHGESQENGENVERVPADGETELHAEIQNENKATDSTTSEAEETEQTMYETSVLVKEVELIGDKITLENMTSESDSLQNATTSDATPEALQVSDHPDPEVLEEKDTIPKESDTNIIPKDKEVLSKLTPVVHKRKMGSTRRPLKGNRKGREHPDENETLDSEGMINVEKETINSGDEPNLDESMLQSLNDGIKEQETEICEKKDVGLDEGCESSSCSSDVVSEESTAVIASHITESQTLTKIYEQSQENTGDAEKVVVVEDTDLQLQTESQNQMSDSISKDEGSEENIDDVSDLVREIKMTPDTVTVEDNMTTEPDLLENYTLVDEKQESLNIQDNTEDVSAVTKSGLLVQDDPVEGSGETNTNPGQIDISITPGDTHREEVHSEMSPVVHKRKMGSTRRPLKGNKGLRKGREHEDEHETLDNGDMINVKEETISLEYEQILDKSTLQISKDGAEEQEICEKKDVGLVEGSESALIQPSCISDLKSEESTAANVCHITESETHTEIHEESQEIAGVVKIMTDIEDVDPHLETQNKTFDSSIDAEGTEQNVPDAVLVGEIEVLRDTVTEDSNLTTESNAEIISGDTDTILNQSEISIPENSHGVEDHLKLSSVSRRKMGSTRRSLRGNKGQKREKEEFDEINHDRKEIILEDAPSSAESGDNAMSICDISESQTISKFHGESQEKCEDVEKIPAYGETESHSEIQIENKTTDSTTSEADETEETVCETSVLVKEVELIGDKITLENMTSESDSLQNATASDAKPEALQVSDHADPEVLEEKDTIPKESDTNIIPKDEEFHSKLTPVVHKRKMGSTRRPLKGNRKGREHPDENETLDSEGKINVEKETMNLEDEPNLDESMLQSLNDGIKEQETEICEKKDVGLDEGCESSSCSSDVVSEESTAVIASHIAESQTLMKIHEQSQENTGDAEKVVVVEDTDLHLKTESQNQMSDSTSKDERSEENIDDVICLAREIKMTPDTVTVEDNMTTEPDLLENDPLVDEKQESLNIQDNTEDVSAVTKSGLLVQDDPVEGSGETNTNPGQNDTGITPEDTHREEVHSEMSPVVHKRKMGSTRRPLRGNKGQRREKEEFDEFNHDRKEIILEHAPSSAESRDTEKTICETSVLLKEVEPIGEKITLENMTSESDSLQNATASDAKPEALQVSDHADPEVLEEKDTIPKESDTNIIPKDKEVLSKLTPVVHKRKMGSTRRPLKGNRKGREHPDENETLDSEGKINVEKETMNLGDEPNLDESMLQSLNDGIKEQETEICEKKDVGLDEGCESSSCSSDVVSEESTAVIASHITESQTLMKIHEQSQENTGDAEKVVVVEDTDLQLQTKSHNQISEMHSVSSISSQKRKIGSTRKRVKRMVNEEEVGEKKEEESENTTDRDRKVEEKLTIKEAITGSPVHEQLFTLSAVKEVHDIQNTVSKSDVQTEISEQNDPNSTTNPGLLIESECLSHASARMVSEFALGDDKTHLFPKQSVTSEESHREDQTNLNPVVQRRKMGSTRKALTGNKGQRREEQSKKTDIESEGMTHEHETESDLANSERKGESKFDEEVKPNPGEFSHPVTTELEDRTEVSLNIHDLSEVSEETRMVNTGNNSSLNEAINLCEGAKDKFILMVCHEDVHQTIDNPDQHVHGGSEPEQTEHSYHSIPTNELQNTQEDVCNENSSQKIPTTKEKRRKMGSTRRKMADHEDLLDMAEDKETNKSDDKMHDMSLTSSMTESNKMPSENVSTTDLESEILDLKADLSGQTGPETPENTLQICDNRLEADVDPQHLQKEAVTSDKRRKMGSTRKNFGRNLKKGDEDTETKDTIVQSQESEMSLEEKAVGEQTMNLSEDSLLSEIEQALNKTSLHYELIVSEPNSGDSANAADLNSEISSLQPMPPQSLTTHSQPNSPERRRRKMGSTRRNPRQQLKAEREDEEKVVEETNENLETNQQKTNNIEKVEVSVVQNITENQLNKEYLDVLSAHTRGQQEESDITAVQEKTSPSTKRKFGSRRANKGKQGLGRLDASDNMSQLEDGDHKPDGSEGEDNRHNEACDPQTENQPTSPPISVERSMDSRNMEAASKGTGAGLVSLDQVIKHDRNTETRQTVNLKTRISDTEVVQFNVVMVGNSCVGKTSFIRRFHEGQYSEDYRSTIGVDTFIQTVQLPDRTVRLQIWDTAGQERFHSITKQVFQKADGVLLMYEIQCSKSFLSVRDWISQARERAPDDVIMMLLGNKNDSVKREVQVQEGQDLAKEYNIHFMECSAATGANVSESMKTLAELLVQRGKQKQEHTTLRREQPQKKSGCC